MITQITAIMAVAFTLDLGHCPPQPAWHVTNVFEAQSSCERSCEQAYANCTRRPGQGMDACAASRRTCYSKCKRPA